MNIKINQVDITNEISEPKAFYYDNIGSADRMRIELSALIDNWKKWNVKRGDIIEVYDINTATGVMYVSHREFSDGLCVITAYSTKQDESGKKSKAYEKVNFLQMAEDAAAEIGMSLKVYGVTNYFYERVDRINKTPLEFLNQITEREGYSLKAFNGNIVIFDREAIETEIDAAEIQYTNFISSDMRTVSKIIAKSKVGIATATYTNAQGSCKIINIQANTEEELTRFSKNLIISANRYEAMITGAVNGTIQAGIKFSVSDEVDFNGVYIIESSAYNFKDMNSMVSACRIFNGETEVTVDV